MTPHIESLPLFSACVCGDISCAIPFGLCHCGCGGKTGISPRTYTRFGIFAGMPTRFIHGHNVPKPRPIVDPNEIIFIDGERCKRIPLTRGQVVIVDAADYDWLNRWNWFAAWAKNTQSFYAKRTGEDRSTVAMHRFILGLGTKDDRLGDHKNGNTLDNRRSNLRIANYSQNCANKKLRKDNVSGFNGVSFEENIGKWLARVYFKKIEYRVGYFDTVEEARDAQVEKAKTIHGEFFSQR